MTKREGEGREKTNEKERKAHPRRGRKMIREKKDARRSKKKKEVDEKRGRKAKMITRRRWTREDPRKKVNEKRAY